MNDNKLIEILKEFDEKRVEQLNDNAKNLFNAIMSIADERDKLLEEEQELIDYLKEKINICDGCIDVMTSDLQEMSPSGIGKTYLTGEIFENKVAKKCYEEILSKIEKSDNNE